MAIYHLSVKAHSRAHGPAGTSALALAAYRSGERLVDVLTGETYDYRRRRGVVHAELCGPAHAPPMSRQEVWARMERRVRRRDGVVAREVEVALPHELGTAHAVVLARALAVELAARYVTAVDLGVHAPAARGRRRGAGDPRNLHAHILIAPYILDRAGETAGRVTALDPSPRLGGRAEVRWLRAAWGERCNRALERAGRTERIDHRSLADQGVDRIPERKRGRAATHAAARTGQPRELSDPDVPGSPAVGRAPPSAAAREYAASVPAPGSGQRGNTIAHAVRLPTIDLTLDIAAAEELAVLASRVLGVQPRARDQVRPLEPVRQRAAERGREDREWER